MWQSAALLARAFIIVHGLAANSAAPVCYNACRGLMAQVDGVIEAVRYKNGRVELVRAYERRGPTFSDHILLDRATLIARIRQGRRFVTGKRTELLASTFEVGKPVALSGPADDPVLTTSDWHEQDRLGGVPNF